MSILLHCVIESIMEELLIQDHCIGLNQGYTSYSRYW